MLSNICAALIRSAYFASVTCVSGWLKPPSTPQSEKLLHLLSILLGGTLERWEDPVTDGQKTSATVRRFARLNGISQTVLEPVCPGDLSNPGRPATVRGSMQDIPHLPLHRGALWSRATQSQPRLHFENRQLELPSTLPPRPPARTIRGP